MFHSGMDHSRLPGIFCLLLLLACGCNDPGYELRRAAYEGNAATVEKILKAHPELINAREKPMPVVAVAPGAPRGSTEWVNKLFEPKGNAFHYCNQSGMTPLHMAARTEREDIVKLLLSHKADVNATNFYDFTPLCETAWRNTKPALVTLLLDAKADLNRKDRYGHTPLEWAAIYGNTNAAKAFIKHGAQVNATNVSGMTPLHQAAIRGHEPMVRLLLSHNAAINDQDAGGNTPLNWAASQGQYHVIVLLVESGGDVNVVNNEGFSPLYRVVQTDTRRIHPVFRLALIDLLLTKKAQVNVTNMFGVTLLQGAFRGGDTNVVNRLRQHGITE
mgnify:CR=1 FL=1